MLFCLIALLCYPALALSFLENYVPNPKVVGKGDYTRILISVYTATLYAPENQYTDDSPIALSLHYHMAFKGSDIVEKSIELMRLQGYEEEKLRNWQRQMLHFFPSVYRDTVLTGVRAVKGNTIFFSQENKIGEIDDPEFAKAFFNIWLGEHSQAPELRKKLLGLQKREK
jgi:hypothetical protein